MFRPLKTVVVTVDDDAMHGIEQLATRLGRSGLDVERVLPLTGVITGTVDPLNFGALGRVPGVASVEEDVGTQLPPPESAVQ